MKTETLACHAGRADFSSLTVHAPPLDLSSTYPLHDLDEAVAAFDALAAGDAPAGTNPVYARLHNPTVRRFETALAELEGTEDAVAFASGMAALTATLLAACEDRRHVVALRPLYGGSDHLLACGLLGLDITWVREAADVAGALRPDTGLVLLETPQNPTLGVVDIAAVVSSAGEVPVVVDNTFATPPASPVASMMQVKNWLPAAIAREKEREGREEIARLRHPDAHADRVHALDRFARDLGVDIVKHSDGEIVVKRPAVLEAMPRGRRSQWAKNPARRVS